MFCSNYLIFMLLTFVQIFVESKETSFLEPFWKTNQYDLVAFCGTLPLDGYLEEITRLSMVYPIAQRQCSNIHLTSNSLIVLYYPETSEIKTLLDKPGAQKSLMSNTWLIIPKVNEIILQYFEGIKIKIGLNAKIFFINDSKELSQILGTGTKRVKVKNLGTLDQVNLQEIIQKTNERQDHQGIILTANYGNFPPYCYVDSNGNVQGTFKEALEIACSFLNLTLVLKAPKPENKNSWFSIDDNGNYKGLAGEVHYNEVDTSIGGFVATLERSEAVDFTQGIFKSIKAIMIKTPLKTDVSLKYFYLEFTSMAWMALVIVEVSVLFVLAITIYVLSKFEVEKLAKESAGHFAFKTAINIILRALINKGSNNPLKSQTYRILVFILMVFGVVIMSYYRAQLNAALNVDDNQIPIRSWWDVDKSDYKILVWIGGSSGAKFQNAPKNSIFNKILKEKILTVPEENQLQNIKFKGSIPAILSNEYLVFTDLVPFLGTREYPCEITAIDSNELRDVSYLSIPLAKESPFLEPLKKALFQMNLVGIIDNIWERHQTLVDTMCEERKNPLGYPQLIFPMVFLLIGIFICLVILLLEICLNKISF